MVPLCFLIVSLELFQLVGSSVGCPIGQGLKNEICVDCSQIDNLTTINQTIEAFRPPSVDLLHELSKDSNWLASQIFEVGFCTFRLIRVKESYLALYDENEGIQGVLPLNFNAKFETVPGHVVLNVIQQPNEFSAIILYSLPSNTSVRLRHANPEVINRWKVILLRFINRVGFKDYFKFINSLGKGGYASIFEALDIESNLHVAVKKFDIKKEPTSKNQWIQSQITILRLTNHNNINKIMGVYQEGKFWFAILELMKGGELGKKIYNNSQTNPFQIKSMLKSILIGLEYLQSQHIFHQDLKPNNIMFKQEGTNQLVIIDLGYAMNTTKDQNIFGWKGKPGFIPPEILRCYGHYPVKASPIGDMFSLGIIFHIMLTGQQVVKQKGFIKRLNQNRRWQFKFDQPRYDIFTRSVIDLLRRMLDPNPLTRINATEALKHPFFDGEIQVNLRKVASNAHILNTVEP